jgi:hypothetical protein
MSKKIVKTGTIYPEFWDGLLFGMITELAG